MRSPMVVPNRTAITVAAKHWRKQYRLFSTLWSKETNMCSTMIIATTSAISEGGKKLLEKIPRFTTTFEMIEPTKFTRVMAIKMNHRPCGVILSLGSRQQMFRSTWWYTKKRKKPCCCGTGQQKQQQQRYRQKCRQLLQDCLVLRSGGRCPSSSSPSCWTGWVREEVDVDVLVVMIDISI